MLSRSADVAHVLGTCNYVSDYGPGGYAQAARRCVLALARAGCDIVWTPVSRRGGGRLEFVDASSVDDDQLRALQEPQGKFDTVIAHTNPEYYPAIRQRYPDAMLIGHTVWETDRLPRHWISLMEVPDLMVVPCRWNAAVIRGSSVSTPVAIVPHVAAPVVRVRNGIWDAIPADQFVFYTIGLWEERKAIWSTVRAYLRAFTRADPVLLVVKTHLAEVSQSRLVPNRIIEEGTTPLALARVIREADNPAPVHLVARVLPEQDIDGLHTRGDCFVSLTRSEGWGIPAFDAAAYGNPIIMTGFGGQLDYLDPELAYLVDFDFTLVDGFPFGPFRVSDEQWAEPSVEHGAELMRRVYEDQPGASARARRLGNRIRQRYRPGMIAASLARAVEAHRPR